MKVQFINHASYVLYNDEIALMIDPWIEGSAFHDGWSHIEQTRFSYREFERITHIWFSHEHPDHFSPPNLKQIPEEIRSTITILYQESKDGKVADFCKTLNFKNVIELNKNWHSLASDFKILNVPHTDGDSWLCVKAEGKTVLNINDCVIENKIQGAKIKSLIGQDSIDLLFTQFSYANWAGNKDDPSTRKQFAQKKIEQVKYQVETFKPKYTIPFASFVWFSHEENFYMNDEINKIDFVYHYIIENLTTIPIIMFLNDNWTIGEQYDNEKPIKEWIKSYESNISLSKATKSKFLNPKELTLQGNKFIESLKRDNTFWIKWFLKPSFIYVSDYDKTYKLDIKNGFVSYKKDKLYCDIDISSDALNYCFKFLWGAVLHELMAGFKFQKKEIFIIGRCIFKLLN